MNILFKKKINTFIFLSLLLGCSSVFSQNIRQPSQVTYSKYSSPINKECLNKEITPSQIQEINILVLLSSYYNLKQSLYTNCFYTNNIRNITLDSPFFYVRTSESLKYLLGTNVKSNFKKHSIGKIDTITYYLLNPFLDFNSDESAEFFDYISLFSEEEKLQLNPQNISSIEPISISERDKILSLLLKNYDNRDFYHRDIFNNSISTYSLVTLEPKIFFNSFPLKPNLGLLQKNKDNLSLFHIAFLTKHSAKPSKVQEDNLNTINQFLIKNFSASTVNLLIHNDISFIDYIYIMRDNNPQLYEALKNKINPSYETEISDSLQEKIFDYYNQFDYIQNIVDMFDYKKNSK